MPDAGCCGLLVSLSTFLMINATSALTYNIVGHLKTVTILTMVRYRHEIATKVFVVVEARVSLLSVDTSPF